MGTGKIDSTPAVSDSQTKMVPVDENEMSWVVGVNDTTKKGHNEETIDEEGQTAQIGEHVAAKI